MEDRKKAEKGGVVIEEKTSENGGVVVKIIQKRGAGAFSVNLLLIAIIMVAAVVLLLLLPRVKERMFPSPVPEEPPIVALDEFTQEDKAELLKNRTIEITNIVVGEARQRKELLVLERDVSVDSVWEESWGGFEIFTKSKRIISYGTGYYNIDLNELSGESVEVNHELKKVLITVPRAYLKSISIDEGKTQYEDTQRGLLSFGEIKLTMEQQGLLKASAESAMRDELSKPEALEEADKVGALMLAKIYRPLVEAIDEYFTVEVALK